MKPILKHAIVLLSFLAPLSVTGEIVERSSFEDSGRNVLTANLTVNIPTDYPTLQAAIDGLAATRAGQGVRIVLRIESGHRPASGISVRDGDYSRFYIEAQDSTVTVAADFSGAFVRGENAAMPVLACLVDMDHKGGDGYSARTNAKGMVLGGCGVINAGSRGLYVNGASFVAAERSNFSGANSRTLWVTRGSTVHAERANLSNGLQGARALGSSVSARRASVIHAQRANISNANGTAVSCDRASKMNLQNANVSGAAGVALFATRGSIISAGGANLSNASSNAVRATEGATISVERATIDRSGGMGISASNGATVSASNVTLTNSGSHGVLSASGAVVTLIGGTVSGSAGHDLMIRQGGTIIASDTITSSGAPSVEDTNVAEFSQPGPNGILYGP